MDYDLSWIMLLQRPKKIRHTVVPISTRAYFDRARIKSHLIKVAMRHKLTLTVI